MCGPYVVRRHKHGSLDLGLYSRRSMERYLDEQAREILEITRQGMDFYAQLFDQPYPFTKYDQVFVPEYNSGAMENVGCVTYNELYLFRDPPRRPSAWIARRRSCTSSRTCGSATS